MQRRKGRQRRKGIEGAGAQGRLDAREVEHEVGSGGAAQVFTITNIQGQ
jgi:hypothetical protein